LHEGKGGKDKELVAGHQEMVVPVREAWIFLLRCIWRLCSDTVLVPCYQTALHTS